MCENRFTTRSPFVLVALVEESNTYSGGRALRKTSETPVNDAILGLGLSIPD